MSAQPQTTPEQKQERMIGMMEETFGNFVKVANASSVYGEPVKSGDKLIIPAAEVTGRVGMGTGFGIKPHGDGAKGEEQAGGGGGGGGRIISRPVAMVVAGPEGVQVEPVIDKTRITLAGLIAGGIIGVMLMRLLRSRR